MAIFANKIDLIGERQVEEKEGREFAQSVGLPYYETSSLKGIGINDAFKELGIKYINKNSDPNENPHFKLKDKEKESHCCGGGKAEVNKRKPSTFGEGIDTILNQPTIK